MFCHVPKALHNKGVSAIPSLCIYKLSQNSNYEIRDCFYNEGIAQNHAFKLQWNFHKHLDYNCKTLMY
jgi:hypothetical protein